MNTYCKNTDCKRTLLFLIGCIGTRALFAYAAKIASTTVLFYMGLLAAAIAGGFIYVWLTGSRKTGVETMGAPIWWNELRPIHALLYTLFAYNAIIGQHTAWRYLALDVVFGLVIYLLHRFHILF
jgi:hypothetical protein